MVNDDKTVPSYFLCPISLEVMTSPVSLCTGVTYERSNIQRWLDAGNNTCPATMQLLHSKDLVPNHTLHHLIQIWSPPPHTHVLPHSHLLHHIPNLTSQPEEDNGRLLPPLLSLVPKIKDLSHMEKIIRLCNALLQNLTKVDDYNAIQCRVQTRDPQFTASIAIALKEKGRPDLRTAGAKLVDLMAERSCLEMQSISEEDDIYLALLTLIADPVAVDASLSLLTRLAQARKNLSRMVRAGGVRALATALEADMSAPATEKVLRLLEMASACGEGRSEICRDEICAQAIVKKLMKLSPAATEHAVMVLWKVCCLFGDRRATAAAAAEEGNGEAKVLLLLQRECSPAVRRMCGDLLRVFRSLGKGSGVCWYNTKATHIMPF
ncbi:U-box domain-containing protein 29 [Striga hermonthica]|uniref:U-box domain-containing protein n=1 Tax=Striga hermonthica TaxID=68872 RepID=A0A9N7R355_STRHE|nr:U-box domain-containing protein 29 [Striga hermonthica]